MMSALKAYFLRTRLNEQIGVCTIQTLSKSLSKGANRPASFARIFVYL